MAANWQAWNLGQGSSISLSVLYNDRKSSDDYVKSTSALPGG
jgi:hypothetical protein